MSQIGSTSSAQALLEQRIAALRDGTQTQGAAQAGPAGAGQGAGATAGPQPVLDAAMRAVEISALEGVLQALKASNPEPAPIQDARGSEGRLDGALKALTDANNATMGASGATTADIMRSLGRALIEMQAHQRTAALQSRTLGYQEAQAKSLEQASKMKDAAADMEKGATRSMIISATVGTVGLAMSGAAAFNQSKQFGKMVSNGQFSKASTAGGDAADAAETAAKAGQMAASPKATKIDAVAKKGDVVELSDIDVDMPSPTKTGADKTAKARNAEINEIDLQKTETVKTERIARNKDDEVDLEDLDIDIDFGPTTGSKIDGLDPAAQGLSPFDIASKRFDYYSTLGQIGQTVGSMGSAQAGAQDAHAQANAKRDEAKGSEASAQSTAAQQRADMAKDVQQQLEDMIRKIIDFVKEMQDNEIETMRSITRG